MKKTIKIFPSRKDDLIAALGISEERAQFLNEEAKRIARDSESHTEVYQLFGEVAENLNEYTFMIHQHAHRDGLVHGHHHPQCARAAYMQAQGHEEEHDDIASVLQQIFGAMGRDGKGPKVHIVDMSKAGEA